MADFVVFTGPDGAHDTYSDGSTHSFDEHGHLVATRANGVRVVYSETGWVRLEEGPPTAPDSPSVTISG